MRPYDDHDNECLSGDGLLSTTGSEFFDVPLNDEENKKHWFWEICLNFNLYMSEFSNIGIVLQAVSKWLPIVLQLGCGLVPVLAALADILIYIFKSLARITLIIGRKLGVVFEDEKNGYHHLQTKADLVAIAFYVMAILFFASVFMSGPIGAAIGWVFAMVGLTVVGVFDYYLQVKLSKQALVSARMDKNIHPDKLALLEEDYKATRLSAILYGCLLVGLVLLLVAGPFSLIVAKAATIFLVTVAICRFLTHRWKKRVNKKLKLLDEETNPLDNKGEQVSQPGGLVSSQSSSSFFKIKKASTESMKCLARSCSFTA
jgi:hypothetical protein